MPAKASTVTDLISFTATGASISPISGSITITFDPTLTYTDATGPDVFLSSLGSISVGSPLAFTYTTGSGGFLTLGGLPNGADNAVPGTNDFLLQIGNFNTTPFVNLFFYSQVGQPTPSFASSGTVTITQLAPTPLPATLPLMLSAILALGGGWFLQNRRRISPGVPAAIS